MSATILSVTKYTGTYEEAVFAVADVLGEVIDWYVADGFTAEQIHERVDHALEALGEDEVA